MGPAIRHFAAHAPLSSTQLSTFNAQPSMIEHWTKLLPYVQSLTAFAALELQAIVFLAVKLRQGFRGPISGFLLFVPVLCGWTYIVCFFTTNDPFFDNTIGCNTTNLLLVSFQLLALESCPTAKGTWQRISLAWTIRTSPRSPSWKVQAPKHTQDGNLTPLERLQSRNVFLRRRLLYLIVNLLCLGVINDISRGISVTSQGSFVPKFAALLLPAWVYCGLNCMYYPWSITSVWLKTSRPNEWPYLFNLKPLTTEVWSVGLFWG
jgi:hypothetical protein